MTLNNESDRRYHQNEDRFIADDLDQMRAATNYNEWLFSLIKPYIGKKVLEIGAGIGTFSQKLIPSVDFLIGVEPNPYCSNYLRETMASNEKFKLVNKKLEECSSQELGATQIDTVLCMNVLEHIEDDKKTLQYFEALLQPGGRVVLLLPAVSCAYGPIDEAVGHFRRYSKKNIEKALSCTNLDLEVNSYSNFLGLIGWWFNAKIRRSTNQSIRQIKVFDNITPLIAAIERILGCPIGLSLITVSRRRL